jgi:hypothetical protein
MLLQHRKTNQLTYQLLSGINAISAGAFYTGGVSPDWRVAAVGNFSNPNSPTHADLIWRSQTTSALSYWLLNGTTPMQIGNLNVPGAQPSSDWQIVGAGRFNASNNYSDVIWQSSFTNALSYWFLTGTTRDSYGSISPTPDAGWQVVAACDFDNDGFSDLLLRNTTTNQLAIWYMNGVVLRSSPVMVTDSVIPNFVAGANWKVVGAFNGSGQVEIFFENIASSDNDYGRLVVWYMSGAVRIGAAYLNTTA